MFIMKKTLLLALACASLAASPAFADQSDLRIITYKVANALVRYEQDRGSFDHFSSYNSRTEWRRKFCPKGGAGCLAIVDKAFDPRLAFSLNEPCPYLFPMHDCNSIYDDRFKLVNTIIKALTSK